MKRSKRLQVWLCQYLWENKGLTVTIAVLLLGAIPLYFYALSIGQLPDFSLADLTGVLIASFLTELVLGTTFVAYMLAAGFATRKVVNLFYPESAATLATSGVGSAPSLDVSHHYLIKGRFIAGVTIVNFIIWFGLATDTFNQWLAPKYPGLASSVYTLSLLAALLLLLMDWRKGWRTAKYALASVLVGSIVFLGVFAVAFAWGFVDKAAPRSSSAHASSSHLPDLNAWANSFIVQLLHEHLLVTAIISAAIGVCAMLLLAWWARARRLAPKQGGAPGRLIQNEVVNLIAAKIVATIAFGICTVLIILFFGLVIGAGSIHGQVLTALAGGCYVIILNWIAFVARDWKARVGLGLLTFWVVLVYVPMQSENASYFPKMIVRTLGFGNLHAASVALSGLQCATLAPYGVNCASKKDTSISITNVNILNRLGSTVIIELQVQRIDHEDVAAEGMAEKTESVDDKRPSPLRVEVNDIAKLGDPGREDEKGKNSFPCDRLLIERLRVTNPAKADSLACVMLSVPKEQLLGQTTNGFRTYGGDFSQFIPEH